MKIRSKATLGIAFVALATTALFSILISTQLLRETYTLVDRELYAVGDAVFNALSGETPEKWRDKQLALASRYWLKILDSRETPRYLSPMAQRFDLPFQRKKDRYLIRQQIPIDSLWVDPEDRHELKEVTDNNIKFRVKILVRRRGTETYTIAVAKPLLFFDLELYELLTRVAASLAGVVLLIFAASYYLAGRVLRPLAVINTEIKEIQEKSLNRRLALGRSQDEIFVLSQSLNAMFDRLQHSFRRQKEFVGNAAHELKSPLSILMLGHEEMLAGPLPEPLRRELNRQLHTLRRLAKLVRDLLEISRLEQEERLTIESVDLSSLTRQVLEEYRELLEARGIAVDSQLTTLPFPGDRDKIFRLLVNLLDNAIKYTDQENGKIRIVGKSRQGWVELILANTGPQIPPADLPRLCEQFFRVEKSRSQDFGGSGLGLTIVQRIVELHRGTIEITSEDGWNTFRVRFPVGNEELPN